MTEVLVSAINIFFSVLYFVLFARIVVSWFPGSKDNRVAYLLSFLTEPILAPIRSVLRRFQSSNNMRPMFDFSPLVAILLVQVVRSFIFRNFM